MSQSAASGTHLVLIPSYNSGPQLLQTVREARAVWNPVWVVIDGSDDGSGQALAEATRGDPGVRLIELTRNGGKGAAILAGLDAAAAAGFTHALTMDGDGQHPAGLIGRFMDASRGAPDAMVLGVPRFGPEAPAARVHGRRISNLLTGLAVRAGGGAAATPGAGARIGDCLFGFRVYPIAPLRDVMHASRWMRRFDFDAEAAVRLCWAGIRPINLEAGVRYLRPEQGGVSHFRYGRDNLLLAWMHTRLLFSALGRRMPLRTARPRRRHA